mgnify:CR=1 FL=1
MARKHPHLFEKEIKGISPRTFGINLTGNSGYGVAAALTGISNDFPHTNPRNAYLYEKLLKEYAKNVDNSTDLNFGDFVNITDEEGNLIVGQDGNSIGFGSEFENLFPDFAADNRNSHFGFTTSPDFFDQSNNEQLYTGVPLETYSGHCVFFNSGMPLFHGKINPGFSNEAINEINTKTPCIQTYSGGQTGFFRTLTLTGVKFNTDEAKAANNSEGGPIKKVYLDNRGNGKFHDIFFRDSFTGTKADNGTVNQGSIGGRLYGRNLNHNTSPTIFSRLNLHNNFLDLGKNGTFGPFATGTQFSRTLTNGVSLANGKKYRLLFTRVQNNKIVDHLQHSDFPISGISYLDLFEQNFDVPKLDGVHVHVFNFGKVRLQQNPGISGGGTGPLGPNIGPQRSFYKDFQQSGNPNAPGTGGRIDFSAFNLYTALLD